MKQVIFILLSFSCVFGGYRSRYDYTPENYYNDIPGAPLGNLNYQPSYLFQNQFDHFYTGAAYCIKPYSVTKSQLISNHYAYEIAGTAYTRAAAGVALPAKTIAPTKYLAIRLEIGVDGTIDVVPSSGTDYATEALAIAALPALSADHVSMGYVTIYNGLAGNFVTGTTEFYTTTLTQAPWNTFTGDTGVVVKYYHDGNWGIVKGTPTLDVTNNATGASCMNLIAGNDAYYPGGLWIEFPALLDLTHATMHIRYKIVNNTGLKLPDASYIPVLVYLVSNEGALATPAPTAYGLITNLPAVTGEWHDIYITTNALSEIGLDKSQVKGIHIRLAGGTAANNVANVIFDAIDIYTNSVDTAWVCIGVDDGRSVQIPAIKYAIGKGVRTYWAIMTDLVGTPNYATWAQIKELYNSGLVDVVCHRGYPDYTTESALREYCRRAKKDLLEQGFPAQCADVLVLPSGTDGVYRATVTAEADDDYLTIGTGVNSGSFSNGEQVYLYTAGTYPTGLAAQTKYYVVGATGTKFKLSTTLGGDAIDLTGDGSGTIYCLKTTVPSDTRNPTTEDFYILREYFSKVRGTYSMFSGGDNIYAIGSSSRDIKFVPKVRPNRWWVWCTNITAADYATDIAAAKTAGCIYSGYSHINGVDMTLDQWKAFIDHIAAQVVAGNVTVKSLYEI